MPRLEQTKLDEDQLDRVSGSIALNKADDTGELGLPDTQRMVERRDAGPMHAS